MSRPFSVERSQEIATVLKTYNFKHKVVMDGMALKANQIMSRHPAFLKDAEMFKRAIGEAEWIQGWSRRRRVVEEPCVIISPAGMLVGGSAIFYTQQIANSEKNGIAIAVIPGRRDTGQNAIRKACCKL